jgi:hypothetical protein
MGDFEEQNYGNNFRKLLSVSDSDEVFCKKPSFEEINK